MLRLKDNTYSHLQIRVTKYDQLSWYFMIKHVCVTKVSKWTLENLLVTNNSLLLQTPPPPTPPTPPKFYTYTKPKSNPTKFRRSPPYLRRVFATTIANSNFHKP
ncbi:hypothetical protein HanRHA438_Chr09g0382491 [Helianthus annuus]|nr:hypothetical protein HanRHA438_Chr09g0382491 [Helianthus annuus]